MNKFNLIVWGVPMYPVLWAYTMFLIRYHKGVWPPVRVTTAALHHVYREHWHDIILPLPKTLVEFRDSPQ